MKGHLPIKVGLGIFSLAGRCKPASSTPYSIELIRSGLELEIPNREKEKFVGLGECGGLRVQAVSFKGTPSLNMKETWRPPKETHIRRMCGACKRLELIRSPGNMMKTGKRRN